MNREKAKWERERETEREWERERGREVERESERESNREWQKYGKIESDTEKYDLPNNQW